MPYTGNHLSLRDRILIIDAYGTMVEERILNNFDGYFVTFMFNDICGTDHTKLAVMMNNVETFYETFVTRVVRRARTAQIDRLPKLIAIPDRPIYKKNKSAFADNAINEGFHVHGIMCVPPVSRLDVGLKTHLKENESTYTGPFTRLQRFDVRRIKSEPGQVIDYLFKQFKRNSSMYEHLLILPKTRNELLPKESQEPTPKRELMQW